MLRSRMYSVVYVAGAQTQTQAAVVAFAMAVVVVTVVLPAHPRHQRTLEFASVFIEVCLGAKHLFQSTF